MSESENSKTRWIKHVPMRGIPHGGDNEPADLLSEDLGNQGIAQRSYNIRD